MNSLLFENSSLLFFTRLMRQALVSQENSGAFSVPESSKQEKFPVFSLLIREFTRRRVRAGLRPPPPSFDRNGSLRSPAGERRHFRLLGNHSCPGNGRARPLLGKFARMGTKILRRLNPRCGLPPWTAPSRRSCGSASSRPETTSARHFLQY